MADQAKRRNILGNISLQPLWVLLLLATFVMIIKVVGGPTAMFARPTTRFLICVGFFLWAYVYFAVSKTWVSILFGVAKIVAALLTDWYQLGKIGQEGWHNNVWDRWVFIAAALVVISSGFKDIAEGVKALKGTKSGA
jgi:hypothetical protein